MIEPTSNIDKKLVDYTTSIKNPVEAGRFSTASTYRNPGESSSKFILRLPDELRASLEELAAKEGRSLNAEVQHLLSEMLSKRTNKNIEADVSATRNVKLIGASDKFDNNGNVIEKNTSSKISIRVEGVPAYAKSLGISEDSVTDSITMLALPGTEEFKRSIELNSLGAAKTVITPDGDVKIVSPNPSSFYQQHSVFIPHQMTARKVIGDEVVEEVPVRSTDSVLSSLEDKISKVSSQLAQVSEHIDTTANNLDSAAMARSVQVLDTLTKTHQAVLESDKQKRSLFSVNISGDVKIAEKGINIGNINSNNANEAEKPDTRTGVERVKDGVFKIYDALTGGISSAAKPIGMACIAAGFAFGTATFAHKAMPDVFPEATAIVAKTVAYVNDRAPKFEKYVVANSDRIEMNAGTDGINVSMKAKANDSDAGKPNAPGVDAFEKEQSEARTNFMHMVSHYGEGWPG